MRWTPGILLATMCALAVPAQAQLLFSDDFNGIPNGGQPAGWTSLHGGWVVENGTYHASSPDNFPPASAVIDGISLSDFTMEFDVLNAFDGGALFHLQDIDNALAFILRPGTGQMYFHERIGGNWGAFLNGAAVPGGAGLYHVSLTGVGNTYTANVTVGNQTYTTSRTTATLPSGQFALYDFSSQQRFDNVRLYGALGNTEVPEPGAVAMAVGMAGLGGLLFVRRRNR